MPKNDFILSLDEDLYNVFYDIEKFGIEFEYQAGGVAPGLTLRGIFDSDPSTNPIQNSDSEFIDDRPTLRMRGVDLVDERPDVDLDIFIIDGKTYRPVDYMRTKTGETIIYMMD